MSSSSLAIAVSPGVARAAQVEASVDGAAAPLNERVPLAAGPHRVTLTLRLRLRDSIVFAETGHSVQLAPGSETVLSPLAAVEGLLTEGEAVLGGR